jgi:hypothetical protein
MFKRISGLFWKKLHNRFTLFSFASLFFGVAMYLTGTFLPSSNWSWVTPQLAQLMSILGFTFFILAILLFIIGISTTKTEDATPSFSFLFGLKNSIWKLYKFQQSKVESAKMLNNQQLDEVLKTMRRDLKTNPKIINQPLTEDQTANIIKSSAKKVGVKDNQITSKSIQLLNIMGLSLDKYGVGVSSLVQGSHEYDEINNKLNISRLRVKKDKQIKELKQLSYSLNTILLALIYYEPTAKKIAPTLKLPHKQMKEALDEEMQRYLEKL